MDREWFNLNMLCPNTACFGGPTPVDATQNIHEYVVNVQDNYPVSYECDAPSMCVTYTILIASSPGGGSVSERCQGLALIFREHRDGE